jgi:hypothetical protein
MTNFAAYVGWRHNEHIVQRRVPRLKMFAIYHPHELLTPEPELRPNPKSLLRLGKKARQTLSINSMATYDSHQHLGPRNQRPSSLRV